MFGSATRSPTDAYAKVGIETGVVSANPYQLILMLFDGALVAIGSARASLAQKNIPQKGQAITKAIDIISNGLKASLDMNSGGELAERLGALYDYMCARLLYANVHDSDGALAEVTRLLTEIKGAWEEIANDPAVLSANRPAA